MSDSCSMTNMSSPACSPGRVNVWKLAFDFSLLATDPIETDGQHGHSLGHEATETCYQIPSLTTKGPETYTPDCRAQGKPTATSVPF